jgi:hypothetical protein
MRSESKAERSWQNWQKIKKFQKTNENQWKPSFIQVYNMLKTSTIGACKILESFEGGVL